MAFILNESFTTGALPADWFAGSSGDFAYATFPAPLEGVYSYLLTTGNIGLFIAPSEVTGESWGHFMFYTPALPTAGFDSFFLLRDEAFALILIRLFLFDDGTLQLVYSNGAGSFDLDDPLDGDTIYHIWWRYKPGTGSNGEIELWVNTTNNRSTTPAGWHGLVTNSTDTEGVANLAFLYSGAGGTTDIVIDTAQWADTDEFSGVAARRFLLSRF